MDNKRENGMLFRKTAFLIACLAPLAAAPALAGADLSALTEEGKRVMMKFGKTLKGELKKAVKEKGFAHAINVCNVKAPEIAEKISASEGWTVARSSHKLRNPHNAPDAFTKAAIEEFLARQAKGEDPKKMIKTAIVEENGKRVFRLVKAIPTAKLCLNCHGGDNVKPEVEAVLKEHYPEDKARGFKAGEMRGVFTLKKILE